ncbi:serine/threonine protein phosphatase [Dissulfurirhabdus thermomarina]|uniref:Serine/threonine protein phosphatase n=1 Tax=Dissulfurirhabdus thermomarina TaxID=1765737 RepID=A0A6N9TY41_DISTH|nr:metallophosphoesterase [Dissulfurirhabdus thermomarina]NDY43396.1 serine/threonine protein phosphatase [Dissulfurirhabdus thermomarina]NMX23644.1 serine/threonine protein phosphatase [Dissulfurirhabdus thermomarina]
MRVIAFGDIHMEYGELARIPGLAEADLVIVTGDFTNFGGEKEAEKVLGAIRRYNGKILAVPGNLDQPEVAGMLHARGINLHADGVMLGETGIVGVGGSNPTPFNTPTEFPEERLAALMEKGLEKVREAKRLILVSHAPPVDTATDRIPSGAHVGSRAVRDFIERHRPLFCLTGHIHEARGTDRIGETLVLNPGMLSHPGWIELEETDGGEWTAVIRP